MGKIFDKMTRTLEISNKALIKKVETLKARREKREKYYYDLLHPTADDILLEKSPLLRKIDYKRLALNARRYTEREAKDALKTVVDLLEDPKEIRRFIENITSIAGDLEGESRYKLIVEAVERLEEGFRRELGKSPRVNGSVNLHDVRRLVEDDDSSEED